MILAVNRRYGRADYLPCITWGSLAHQCGGMEVGSTLYFEGRLQSRTYTKNLGDRTEERVAFEVSVMNLAAREALEPARLVTGGPEGRRSTKTAPGSLCFQGLVRSLIRSAQMKAIEANQRQGHQPGGDQVDGQPLEAPGAASQADLPPQTGEAHHRHCGSSSAKKGV